MLKHWHAYLKRCRLFFQVISKTCIQFLWICLSKLVIFFWKYTSYRQFLVKQKLTGLLPNHFWQNFQELSISVEITKISCSCSSVVHAIVEVSQNAKGVKWLSFKSSMKEDISQSLRDFSGVLLQNSVHSSRMSGRSQCARLWQLEKRNGSLIAMLLASFRGWRNCNFNAIVPVDDCSLRGRATPMVYQIGSKGQKNECKTRPHFF